MSTYARLAGLIVVLCLASVPLVPLVALADGPATSPPDVTSPAGPGYAPAAEAGRDNMILNGDFELSSFDPGCHFNLPNGDVTANLTSITAWGGAEEIDYMNDGTSCDYSGPPQSGAAKLAIHHQDETGYVDAFCFDLETPAVAGVTYTVSFYIQANTDSDPNIGAVEIGLSSSATEFGVAVAEGIGTVDGWTLVEHTFEAPVTAEHLCVQPMLDSLGWNHLDDFTLMQAAVPVSNLDWSTVRSNYR